MNTTMSLWCLVWRGGRVVGVLHACCEDAVQIMYMEEVFAVSFDSNTRLSNIINIYNILCLAHRSYYAIPLK